MSALSSTENLCRAWYKSLTVSRFNRWKVDTAPFYHVDQMGYELELAMLKHEMRTFQLIRQELDQLIDRHNLECQHSGRKKAVAARIRREWGSEDGTPKDISGLPK